MARPVGKAETPRDTREDRVYVPLQVQEPGGAPDVWHHIAASWSVSPLHGPFLCAERTRQDEKNCYRHALAMERERFRLTHPAEGRESTVIVKEAAKYNQRLFM